MKIKVKYDPEVLKVLGYYPENQIYRNNEIDADNKTIDGFPYIEISAEELNTDKTMCVIDGEYREYMSPTYIQDLKGNVIRQIKGEASSRIVAVYPEWKQRNHMAAVIDIQNKELIALKANTTYTLSADELAIVAAAQAAKTEIFNIRAKSDELEASLDTMTQEQLEAFDATNDSNWV